MSPKTTREVRMTKNLIVCGELWKKGKKYAAERNEFNILVEELKAANPVTD